MTKKEMQAELDRLRQERAEIAKIMIEDVGNPWLPRTRNMRGKRILEILGIEVEDGCWGWKAAINSLKAARVKWDESEMSDEQFNRELLHVLAEMRDLIHTSGEESRAKSLLAKMEASIPATNLRQDQLLIMSAISEVLQVLAFVGNK